MYSLILLMKRLFYVDAPLFLCLLWSVLRQFWVYAAKVKFLHTFRLHLIKVILLTEDVSKFWFCMCVECYIIIVEFSF